MPSLSMWCLPSKFSNQNFYAFSVSLHPKFLQCSLKFRILWLLLPYFVLCIQSFPFLGICDVFAFYLCFCAVHTVDNCAVKPLR